MSDKAQPTPGPWSFHQATGKLYATLRAGGRMLAILRNPISDADGRLIAAAPDMLAALQGLVALHDSPTRPGDDYAAARAAIAKATGA